MIITELSGGLGNQMFKYAAGLALANKIGTVLKLDTSSFGQAGGQPHVRYALSCFNITECFASEEEVLRLRGRQLSRAECWSLEIARRLQFDDYARRMESGRHLYVQPTDEFDLRFFDQPDFTYLSGIWESEKYFAPVADLLRLHFSFRYPPQPTIAALARQIQSGPSAAIHFRLGDFKAWDRILPLDYYERALDLLYQQHPNVTLYIFSDAMEEVREKFRPQGPHVFVNPPEPRYAFDEMRLISLCDHAIIANSTFSWWGAWLNNNPDKLVFAPDPWNPTRLRGLGDAVIVPNAWNRVSVGGPVTMLLKPEATYTSTGPDSFSPFLGHGWSMPPESWGVWSQGELAQLQVYIDPKAKNASTLCIEGRGFTHGKKQPELKLDIQINNKPIGAHIFKHGQKENLLTIPLVDADGEGFCDIRFQVHNPQSPRDLGVSADARKLGFGIERISLKPIDT